MKKRIGTLNGKPIVTGDPNLATQNEIYKNSTPRIFTVKTNRVEDKYYATFSSFYNVKCISDNTEVFSIIYSYSEKSAKFQPIIENIIPKYFGVIIISDLPEVTFVETFDEIPVTVHNILTGYLPRDYKERANEQDLLDLNFIEHKQYKNNYGIMVLGRAMIDGKYKVGFYRMSDSAHVRPNTAYMLLERGIVIKET